MQSEGTIEQRYAAARPRSQSLYQQALQLFPDGATHDGRYVRPFPIYVSHALGSRKWDVDGNEYIDYVMGNGALLLGPAHPEIVEAVQRQIAKGSHYGAAHELEIEWATLIQQMVPSAERVRFMSSGTEATHMAVRLSRIFTGRDKILKFEGHFHGWHNEVAAGVSPPFDGPTAPGVPRASLENQVVVPANDIPALEAVLAGEANDIAAMIVEPSGASMGAVPLKSGFLAAVRQLSTRHGIVLIFDEVVTGFRWSKGGVQTKEGVVPDLTTLAKAMVGGLPGGACVGRQEIMAMLEHRDDPQWNRFGRMSHPGTFNANPLSAAAGVAALKIIARGGVVEHADRLSDMLRTELRAVLSRRGVAGTIYGESSVTHILPIDANVYDSQAVKSVPGTIMGALGLALQVHGVHLLGNRAIMSAAHSEDGVLRTAQAFDAALGMLLAEGLLKTK